MSEHADARHIQHVGSFPLGEFLNLPNAVADKLRMLELDEAVENRAAGFVHVMIFAERDDFEMFACREHGARMRPVNRMAAGKPFEHDKHDWLTSFNWPMGNAGFRSQQLEGLQLFAYQTTDAALELMPLRRSGIAAVHIRAENRVGRQIVQVFHQVDLCRKPFEQTFALVVRGGRDMYGSTDN